MLKNLLLYAGKKNKVRNPKGATYDEREKADLEKETINANADAELAYIFLESFFFKTRLTSFTGFRQRYVLNSFSWNDPRRPQSQEIGKLLCFKRENPKSSLEQHMRSVTWGADR
jgi:hypothetical protein